MTKQVGGSKNQRETGAMRVYSILRNEILTMKLTPGVTIDEISLSERFSLSRSPIREALVRLSADGLILISPNRTTSVAPMDFSRIPAFLDALDLLQRVVTRLAAMHRTPDEMDAIKNAQRAYEKACASSVKTGNSQTLIEKNYDFHMAIAAAGHNVYFSDLYRRLLEEGRRMLHLHFKFQILDERLTANQISNDHMNIVNAIEQCDVESAEKYAHLHAVQFKGRFMQFLDRNLTANIPLNYTTEIT